MRFSVFKDNLEFIEKNDHEKDGHVSMNEYMDWTDDEFNRRNNAVFPNSSGHPTVQ